MTRVDISIPDYGTISPIADDVYWARFSLPFRLDHVNLYMFDAGESWVLIDCGLNTPETEDHWTRLLKNPLGGKPIGRIVVSHHHVDHIGYASVLAERTGAEVYSSADEIAHARWMHDHAPEDFARMIAESYKSHGFDDETIAVARQDPSRYRRYVKDLPPMSVLNEGDMVASRDGAWRVRIDAGHSSGHISLHDEGRDIYLAMDFLLPRISPNVSADLRKPDHDQLGLYLTYLEDIATTITPSTLILPGHDWPFTDGVARAKELLRHHDFRLNQLRKAAQGGRLTTAMAIDVLFGRVFGPHEVYFAAGEARAHLNHLVELGEMKKQHEKGIDYFELF